MSAIPAIVNDENGNGALILIEATGGSIPVNAAMSDAIKAQAIDLATHLKPVTALARTILDSVRAAEPQAVEIEFGIEVSAKGGIPLVTSGEAKANFKISMSWGKMS